MSAFDDLVEVMARLRGPGGCPWDAKQTHESLLTYLVEESYEVVEAVETGTPDDLREELGDVLLQVVFHADIASASGAFDVDDVIEGLIAKLRSRHPHVFAGAEVSGVDEVVANWDALKRAEKPARVGPFDGIPGGLPGLAFAEKIFSRGERAGVLRASDVAAASAVLPETEVEFGEALLALVAHAHTLGLDADRALRAAARAAAARALDAP